MTTRQSACCGRASGDVSSRKHATSLTVVCCQDNQLLGLQAGLAEVMQGERCVSLGELLPTIIEQQWVMRESWRFGSNLLVKKTLTCCRAE